MAGTQEVAGSPLAARRAAGCRLKRRWDTSPVGLREFAVANLLRIYIDPPLCGFWSRARTLSCSHWFVPP